MLRENVERAECFSSLLKAVNNLLFVREQSNQAQKQFEAVIFKIIFFKFTLKLFLSDFQQS